MDKFSKQEIDRLWANVGVLREFVISKGVGANGAVPATQRQAEVLGYVIMSREAEDCTPSHSQIARYLGVKSKATVAKHIRALKQQGFW